MLAQARAFSATSSRGVSFRGAGRLSASRSPAGKKNCTCLRQQGQISPPARMNPQVRLVHLGSTQWFRAETSDTRTSSPCAGRTGRPPTSLEGPPRRLTQVSPCPTGCRPTSRRRFALPGVPAARGPAHDGDSLSNTGRPPRIPVTSDDGRPHGDTGRAVLSTPHPRPRLLPQHTGVAGHSRDLGRLRPAPRTRRGR